MQNQRPQVPLARRTTVALSLATALIASALVLASDHEPAAPEPIELQPPRAPAVAASNPDPNLRFHSVSELHADHFAQFRSTPGFGASRILRMPTSSELFLGDFTYLVPRPDLLALETKVVAYRSRGDIIGMGDLTNKFTRSILPTRELSAAEHRAVEELRAGKDIVMLPAKFPVQELTGPREVTGRLAVGALRADAACAKCHGCDEGTLLGAFSYALIPKAEDQPPRLLRDADSALERL